MILPTTLTRRLIIAAILLYIPAWLQAQNLNFEFKNVRVETILKKISDQTPYKFVYSDTLKNMNERTSVKASEEDPLVFFNRFFSSLGIFYKVENTQVLLSNSQIIDKTETVNKDKWLLKGTVKDSQKELLIGATIYNISSKTGIISEVDGSFQIQVKVGDKLSISYIGYKSQNITIDTQTNMDIILEEDAEQINEVVVVGYGTLKKSSMVGAVNMINEKDIETRPVTSVANVLTGSTPGMFTTSATGIPGDDPNIRIRGFGTISSSSTPIYVVDGAIHDVSLRGLNPSDIESISVLKDAAATAIYGSRGANGVIIITTKKGAKGRERFSVNMSQGISIRFIDQYEQVSPQDYYQLMYEGLRNSYYYNSSINMDYVTATRLAAVGGIYKGNPYSGIFEMLGNQNPFYGIDNNEIINPVTGKLNPAATYLKWGNKDVDWFDPISRVGNRTELSMSASGGQEKSDYYVSLNYLNDNAWMKKSFTRRLSGRANMNFKPFKWLRLGSNISGSWVSSYNRSWSGANSDNPFFAAQLIGPIYPVYLHNPITGAHVLDANGNKIYDTGNQVIDDVVYPIRPTQGAGRNIVAETLNDDAQYRRVTFSTRTYVEIEFIKGLKGTLSANIVYSPYNGYDYRSNDIGVYAPSGRTSRANRTNFTQTYQQMLSYNKAFGKHEIDIVTGHESYQNEVKRHSSTKTEQVMIGNNEFSNFTTILSTTTSTSEFKTEGYFIRANYSYDWGRYTFETSYRRDGTSKFYKNVRWGDFWSVGVGWDIARENFMQKVEWVNTFKLRASYGVTGNLEGIGNYNWQDLYVLGYNNQSEAGYIQDASAANRSLTWEKQSQLSIALDYALFNGRIKGSVEWYNKKNDDLLFSVKLPYSTGVTSQNQNIGCLFNRGWEIDLSADVIRKKDFRWNIRVNVTTIKNEITHMPDDNPELISGTKKYAVGHSIYDYWLRQWYGVDLRDGSGLYLYDPETLWNENSCRVMSDGTKVTTNPNKALYKYSGSSIPNIYGSIQTGFEYKGLGLTFTATYQIGGKSWDTLYKALTNTGLFGNALHKDMLNCWQKPGDITNVPRMDNAQNSNFNATSTRQLVSNSALWINSIIFYFDLPKTFVQNIGLNSLRIHLNAENLAMISACKGFNPFSTFSGVTSYDYSPSRVLTLGVNLIF